MPVQTKVGGRHCAVAIRGVACQTGVAVWGFITANPWLVVACLALVLATLVILVRFLVKNTDGDITVSLLVFRVKVFRRDKAEEKTPDADPGPARRIRWPWRWPRTPRR